MIELFKLMFDLIAPVATGNEFFYMISDNGGDRILMLSLSVCLVGVKIGRMENRERKVRWKMVFFTVWFRRENNRDRK